MLKSPKGRIGALRLLRRGVAAKQPAKSLIQGEPVFSNADYGIARKRMVEEQLLARDIRNPHVLALMQSIPRHLFVDEALKSQAYQDRPVNIGAGQTISQPYIVALMDELLGLKGHERVLEIGTGCGYQTAILAHLAAEVYSIERIKSLALKAIRRLKQLGVHNVVIRVGDGTLGWAEKAPFDAITVAAATPEVPDPFLVQLKEGGRLVIPRGTGGIQSLMLLEKRQGAWVTLKESPCRFVKLIGKYGW